MSEELCSDNSRTARALQEVFAGLARDACMWTTAAHGSDSNGDSDSSVEGSAMELEDGGTVDCENLTDIARFARRRQAEIILEAGNAAAVNVDVVSVALLVRPAVMNMLGYLRSRSAELVPGSLVERQSWVGRNISPRNRCFVCGSL